MVTLVNARVFDGSKMLPGLHSVTLDGNRIAAIDDQKNAASGEQLDVGGMTLMPGLITSHLHPDFYRYKMPEIKVGLTPGNELPPGVMMAIGTRTCRVLLESGFTGYIGAACSNEIDAQLKMAIEMGIIPGPRIRPCSHHLGTTADANDSQNWWQRHEIAGVDLFVDGPVAMRKLVREEIRKGAEIIKFFGSPGHLISEHRGKRNMSRDEIAALVEATHERGALVRSHVVDKEMILECIELGVDIIDHGDEVDEECIEAMVKAGTFFVPSLTCTKVMMDIGWDRDGTYAKSFKLMNRILPLAHKAGVRILVGDDYSGLFSEMVKDDPLDHQVGCYGREFAFYGQIAGLSPADVLSWATKNPGQLLVKGGDRAGVIEAGALADLIVVDGDPTADLSVLAKPTEKLKAVIQNGVVTSGHLPPPASKQKAA